MALCPRCQQPLRRVTFGEVVLGDYPTSRYLFVCATDRLVWEGDQDGPDFQRPTRPPSTPEERELCQLFGSIYDDALELAAEQRDGP